MKEGFSDLSLLGESLEGTLQRTQNMIITGRFIRVILNSRSAQINQAAGSMARLVICHALVGVVLATDGDEVTIEVNPSLLGNSVSQHVFGVNGNIGTISR